MKKIFFLITVLIATSCDFGSINVDPNNPSDAVVPLSMMLTATESTIAYDMGGRVSWYTAMFTGHTVGINAQPNDFSNYNFTESDCDGLFRDFYATSLSTLNTMITRANNEGSPHYSGMGKVLMAFSLGTLTSIWGDIPYSDAFKGQDGTFAPKYDTQEAIYTSIQQLLDQAIVELQSGTSKLSPGADDIIYAGSRSLWVKAAYALKARYFIHLTKRSTTAAASALTALQNNFVSNAEQFDFGFGITQPNAAPWYQLNNQRPDVRVSPYLEGIFTSLSDPRALAFIDQRASGPFVGLRYSSINSAVHFISYAETKFIEAEALVRTSGTGAQTVFQAAIRASLDDALGSSVTDAAKSAYVTANGILIGTAANQLQVILNQKYIAMFTQSESWVDYRRTGVPALVASSTAVINESNPQGQIPRRFPYPISERLYNAGNIPSAAPSLQTPKLWIDN